MEDLIRKDKQFIDVEKNLSMYQSILCDIVAAPVNKRQRIYDAHARQSLPVKKSILNYVYRRYGLGASMLPLSSQQEMELLRFLQKIPARNMSGVTVITVLTAPYPDGQTFSCKHNCYYCPAEPDQPRSYLMKEPAVARANRNHFDAREQMLDRMDTLLMNGHEIDKLELILEGGTYTEYPVDYLQRFMRDLVFTVNTYFDRQEGRELRVPYTIEDELRVNKTARVKISGICVETRPDCLLEEPQWLIRFRQWGVTRVQIGVQHICDQILEGVNRGHTADTASRAIELLKNNGFKVDMHLMPDLPGSSVDMDEWMFREVYQSPRFQADQIKVYPCQVVPWTVIEKWHKQGKYIPYAETDWEGFMQVVKTAIAECPPWIRLPRVVRDIPMSYVQGGNDKPNLRQMIMDELKRDNVPVMEIRARECARHMDVRLSDARLKVRQYLTTTGKEVFLSMETEQALFGFCRLRLPPRERTMMDGLPVVFPELKLNALVRELHVYGHVMRVGKHGIKHQHCGVGTQLLKEAEQIAWLNGYNGVAVISGCGVEGYYEKRGYQKQEHFMVKQFMITAYTAMWGVVLMLMMLAVHVGMLV